MQRFARDATKTKRGRICGVQVLDVGMVALEGEREDMAKRQLYVLCDMEGGSGISPDNKQAMYYGSERWQTEGREYITSDVLAVCEAASGFGIDEIILNDSHDYGKREPNVLMEKLPENVRLVRRPHLPGKPRHMVRGEPFGMVIVGQHAMYGGGGFAPHTIQSPPIGCITLNDIPVGEIGLELALFMGTRLLAIVGEQAAVNEARQLCPAAIGVPVKSLESNWYPSAQEMQSEIRSGVSDALRHRDEMSGLHLNPPFRFSLEPTNDYFFDPTAQFFLRSLSRFFLFGLCNGRMSELKTSWESRSIIRGLYALESARTFLRRHG